MMRELRGLAEAESKKPNPRFTIKGAKLTLNSMSVDFAGGRVEAPEIDLLKVLGGVAAGVAVERVCQSAAPAEWIRCVTEMFVREANERAKADKKADKVEPGAPSAGLRRGAYDCFHIFYCDLRALGWTGCVPSAAAG